jgi:hypothetical protein
MHIYKEQSALKISNHSTIKLQTLREGMGILEARSRKGSTYLGIIKVDVDAGARVSADSRAANQRDDK